MWKIICAFLLFERALSAPSLGCSEICGSLNAQSASQRLGCCSPPSAALTDNKNWTDHSDFQTRDGALVHTKEGKFAHGNTRGSFNEMSYHKEWNSGNDQNFQGSVVPNFGHNQKLEDLSTSSHSTFEAMFQSQFSEMIKNFHDSFRHLQELKSKDQLPTRDCGYACVARDEQISRLQQDIASQQQHMQRMREDLWSRFQTQDRRTEAEHVPSVQQLDRMSYYPGQVVKEVNRYHSYHNEKVTSHPHVTTTVTNQPDKYVLSPQPTHHTASSREQGSAIYTDNLQSGVQVPAGYNQQNSGYTSQTHGQQSVAATQHVQGYRPEIQGQTGYNQQGYIQNSGYTSPVQSGLEQGGSSSQYRQDYGSGIQSQAGYGSSTKTSQIQSHASPSSDYRQTQAGYTQETNSPTEIPQTKGHHNQHSSVYGHQSYGSQSYYSSQAQAAYGQQNADLRTQNRGYGQDNSGYRTQQAGSYVQGGHGQHNSGYRSQAERQTDASQDCGPQGCSPQGKVTVAQGGMSYSSVTRDHGVGFGSRDGKLTHGLIQMGSAADCDETQPQPYRRYKRHAHYRHYPHHRDHHDRDEFHQQVQDDSQHLEEFGEPTKVQKVSQQEILDLGQQVEDIRHGKLETQDMHNQDFEQQSQFGNDYNQQTLDDLSQNTGKLEFGKHNHHQSSNLEKLNPHYDQQKHGFDDYFRPQSHSQQSQTSNFGHQTDPFSQQTEDLDSFSKTKKVEDQEIQKARDFSYTPTGFNQHTVGNLRLDQPARDSFNFNQFQPPVLAPDSKQVGNQRFDGLNQQFNSPAKPAPKPTSRPRNSKPIQHNLEKNTDAEKIFNMDQEAQSPFENIRNVGRGDISAEIEQVLTPPEAPDTQVGYQQSSKEIFNKDFGQQVLTSRDETQKSHQHFSYHQKSDKDFSHYFHKSDQDFSHVQKELEDFSQSFQKPFFDFSQNTQKSFEDFSQNVQKPFLDFSQNTQKTFEDFSHDVQKPFEDFDQQVSKPEEQSFSKVKDFSENFSQKLDEGLTLHVQKPFIDFSQNSQKPFEDFDQQVLKPREQSFSKVEDFSDNLSQQTQKLDDGLTLHVQKPFTDFSQNTQKNFDDFSQNVEEPFKDFVQQVSKPGEESFSKVEDFSENLSQQTQKLDDGLTLHVQKPFEDFSNLVHNSHKDSSLQINKIVQNFPQQIENAPEDFFKKDFPRQNEKSEEDIFQKVQKPQEHIPKESFQKFQKPMKDFSEQEKISRENFPQHAEKPLDDFSQQIQKSFKDSFLNNQNPFEDLSQQIHKPSDGSLIVQKPREDVSPVQKPIKVLSQQEQISREESLQKIQTPFENDYQKIVKSNQDLSQQIKKSMEDISQHVQRIHKDLSKTSDLNRGKDVTQLPQSFHDQSQIVDHSNSDIFQLGHQWHLSHGPGDLTNENLHLGRLSHGIQQTHKVEEIRQIIEHQTPIEEDEEIKFDQQNAQELEALQEELSREVEILRGTFGKLKLGQSVQNKEKDSEITVETLPMIIQPRILEAYGSTGSYSPRHREEILSDVRTNPSATLPPFVFDDPWDIREKHLTHSDTMNEDRVIPLETTWTYPDEFPVFPPTEPPKVGFWNRVGHRFTSAVDKAKEKARDIFG